MKTNNETHEGLTLDEKIALLLTEVKKITKHLKLDRRGKNDDDSDVAPDPYEERDKRINDVLELVKDIHRSTDREEFTPEQKAFLKSVEDTVNKALRDYHNSEHRELKSELEKIVQALDELKDAKQNSTVHHRHSIDIASSKIFLSMVVMGLMILGLSFVIGSQRRTLGQFRDNDLKYRYIQMQGEATPVDILRLREVFDFNRSPDSIRTIRRQVIEYEKLIREQAETAARARLNATEAQRLQNQAETVKGGRK